LVPISELLRVALRGLPLGITVRFHYFFKVKRNRYWQNQLRLYNETLDERCYILRTQGDAVTRARRHVHKMREQKDQIADVLEATVELRSSGML
jgi:phage terminase large subunit GpA-like protein